MSYYRVESNEKLGIPFFWEIIKSFDPEWIIFPGDDDVLVFDIFEKWEKALKNNEFLNAFAASAQIINSKSELTGETRVPSIYGISSRVEIISRSLHEPPFLWPCLFIRFDALPEIVIASRYVFDWWIGLQIVIKDQVESTKSIGIKYRAHEKQESFQATSRRKNFEGYGMLSEVIKSASFNHSLGTMTDADLKTFFDLCIDTKPLYAQPEFYNALLKDLAFCMTKAANSDSLKNEIVEKYALSAGIYTKKNDLENIYTGISLPSRESEGNLALNYPKDICESLRKVEKLFNQNYPIKVNISCKHSKPDRQSIFVNCKHLDKLDNYEIADLVLLTIDNHFENTGKLNFTITPFERELVKFYRNFKLKIPNLIKKYLSRIKKFIGDKNEI